MSDKHDESGNPLDGMPVFDSGWQAGEWAFEPGEAFWERIAAVSPQAELIEHMDQAMEGKSAPRVWLILHEPGKPELGTAVALAFARELGSRDQATLVLDCDDQGQALTTWAERLESDGWIDLARYGTSVLTSAVPLPFEKGRQGYLLGVGSFAPTDVTGDEIQQLIKRLRRQADDVILTAPADAVGQLWAPYAGIRLLCWDRAHRPAEQIESLVSAMSATGQGVDGLVGFGVPMASPEIPAPVLDDRPDPTIPEPPEDEVDPVPVADDFEAPVAAADIKVDESEVDVAAKKEAEAEPESGWTEVPSVEDKEPKRKGTSGVFWFVTVASVVIVAILGVYWFKYVRVADDGGTQPRPLALAQAAPEQASPVRVPGDQSQGDMANQDDAGAGAEDTAAQPATIEDTTAETQGAEAQPISAQVVAAKPSEVPAEVTPTKVTEFSMVPYRTRVGDGGWALHLYSFPDSTSAEAELAELRRRGFETEIRVVEITDKGRWWRVYVGDFSSRKDAKEATPMLLKKLRTDWAQPTRF